MAHQQLLDYINQQLEGGASRDDVKNKLLAKGWQEKYVDDGFTEIDLQKVGRTETRFKKFRKGMYVYLVVIILAAGIMLLNAATGYKLLSWLAPSRSCESNPNGDWAICSDCPPPNVPDEGKACGGSGGKKRTTINGGVYDSCEYVTGDGKCWQEFPPYLDMSK